MKIGLFDSGFGGMIILDEIIKLLPDYDYLYFGDAKYLPYGEKNEEFIYNRSLQIVDYLFAKNCQLIIIACNTATAVSLRRLQREYLPKKYPDRRILGVIVPTIEDLINHKNDRIGVIGTKMTIDKKVYSKEILKLNQNISVFEESTPLLSIAIENNRQQEDDYNQYFAKEINNLLDKNIQSLVLGCTHYGVLISQIQDYVGEKVKIISQSSIIARKTKLYLQKHLDIEAKLSKNKITIIEISEKKADYRRLVEKWDLNRLRNFVFKEVSL